MNHGAPLTAASIASCSAVIRFCAMVMAEEGSRKLQGRTLNRVKYIGVCRFTVCQGMGSGGSKGSGGSRKLQGRTNTGQAQSNGVGWRCWMGSGGSNLELMHLKPQKGHTPQATCIQYGSRTERRETQSTQQLGVSHPDTLSYRVLSLSTASRNCCAQHTACAASCGVSVCVSLHDIPAALH